MEGVFLTGFFAIESNVGWVAWLSVVDGIEENRKHYWVNGRYSDGGGLKVRTTVESGVEECLIAGR